MLDFDQEARKVGRLNEQLRYARQTIKAETEALEKARTTHKRSQEAQEILQLLAQGVQETAHQRISEVVTSCLATVFDHPYEFKIVFERKRGRTEANLRFVRGELDVDPMTACGGGTLDVAAFALRVSCLMLHRPRLSRIIILDEPFKFVSTQYLESVRQMLEELAKDLDLQIIMVTHLEALETGKVIEL